MWWPIQWEFCLTTNGGRPNPPYVVFKYQGKVWQRIALQELPAEFTVPNLVFSSPDHEARDAGQRIISAERIKALYEGYKQPEHKAILREVVKLGTEGSLVNSEVMIHYKCGWGGPGEFNRKYFENACK
jgi:hypothetical protein